MELIHQDKQRRIVKNREEIKFSSFSSFHLVAITARARSEKQISKQTTDDEELTVTIDDKTFPKLETIESLLDSPASFNGGKLHNLSKTVYFLTFLKGRNHTITLKTYEPHNTATFESLEIYTVRLEKTFTLHIENQAEDGDGRPWITFVLDNLSLKSLTPTVTYSRRKRDSDDVKIIIDGKTQGNILRTIKHFLWRFIGSKLPWSAPSKTETETFTVSFPQALHYIEFWADRMPIVHKITIDFGIKPSLPEGIPSVDNPKWTGNFDDDSDEMLLARLVFGEARNQPKEAKIGVAWTVKNRLLAKRSYFGFSYHEIILKNDGVTYQFSPMNSKDSNNFPVLIDPLKNQDPIARTAWFDSYEVASGVIHGTIPDPTEGAVFFHSSDLSQEEFITKYVPGAIFIKQIGDFLFYKSTK